MNTAECKRIGKANFNRDMGYMIVIAFILSVVEGGGMHFSLNNASSETGSEPNALIVIFALIIAAIILVINLTLSVFVKPVLQTGCCACLIQNCHGQKININSMGGFFSKEIYENIVIIYLRKSLTEFIYSLCFIIPGIIKSYEYFCVPYLTALRPDMDDKEICELSSYIMNGYKMDLFMLRLSFIGWHILSIFTLGILEAVYVYPYLKASETAFFDSIYIEKCAQRSIEENHPEETKE